MIVSSYLEHYDIEYCPVKCFQNFDFYFLNLFMNKIPDIKQLLFMV